MLPYSFDTSVSDIYYSLWHKITLVMHQNYYPWRDTVGSIGNKPLVETVFTRFHDTIQVSSGPSELTSSYYLLVLSTKEICD